MEMLRQWNSESNELLVQHLRQFGVEAEEVKIIKYEQLTPDSFIWFLDVKEKSNYCLERYCMYAEDYIPGLQHVLEIIVENIPIWQQEIGSKYNTFIKVVKPGDWSEASPVRSAAIYQPPKKDEDFMKYAYSSGYDFVFLAR